MIYKQLFGENYCVIREVNRVSSLCNDLNAKYNVGLIYKNY